MATMPTIGTQTYCKLCVSFYNNHFIIFLHVITNYIVFIPIDTTQVKIGAIEATTAPMEEAQRYVLTKYEFLFNALMTIFIYFGYSVFQRQIIDRNSFYFEKCATSRVFCI